MKILVFAVVVLSVRAYSISIQGVVDYKGPKVRPMELRMNADPVCAKQNQGKPVYNDVVSVNEKNQLRNVFVYIKENAPKGGALGGPVIFDQKGCVYVPRVVGLQVGQTLKILNSDATLHNVHSMPKTNATFNLGMPGQAGQSLERKFDKPELGIRMKCDVHGWMVAYVNVVDHPYFSVTGANGEFKIENVPAGKYVLEFWHEKLGTKTVPVTVVEGKDSKITTDMGG